MPCDQATAADSDEHRVDRGDLALEFQAERALSKDRLALVEGMHRRARRIACAQLSLAASASA